MSLKTLAEKFAHELGDIYDAEHRFLDAQQTMLAAASDSQLKQMIAGHIGQTEQQIKNLEQVYKLIGQKPKREKCDAATGIVAEGEKGLKEAADTPTIRDCLIAGSASKVEHYEISSYRGLIQGAQLMEQQGVVDLLKENLKQEEQTAKQVEDSVPTLLKKAMRAEESGQ